MKIILSHKKLQWLVVIVVFFLFTSISVSGQEQKVVRDLAMWTELKLKKTILRDLQFSVGQHFRFNQNISSYEDYIAEAELAYSISKNFSIGATGRFTKNRHYDQTVENEYRYDLNFGYNARLFPTIKFYYRLKYQKDFYGSSVFNEYLDYEQITFRNRLKLAWEVNGLHRLYSSAEIFKLNEQARDSYFSKYRLFLGDDISTRIGDIDAAFGIERELHSQHPLTCYILRLTYQFTL